ncbi:hypothetical protein [Actinokineospora globicatena]|uniref:hypothetical protein n=1 Tax=Actinokineospora globicatena TaxID=103729 RepID=UPI0020A2DBE7|nr:hypothetical protein [Actinokineospora globicatena]MCP2301464.1 hypothetical protein [Actinokineospora globicatena]GLW76893.1 hypothetical protein Aglo01_13750 [Actinokineospora globicatena]GLW83726.1 hypothetical protein Aglo02_13660 [Actinokineospora globicatena]
MDASPAAANEPTPLPLAELTPQFSCTFLRHVGNNAAESFDELVRFVRESASAPGRAISVAVPFEDRRTGDDVIDEVGPLAELGIDDLHLLVRKVERPAGWIPREAGINDLENELVLTVRRGDLILINGPAPTTSQLRKWIDKTLSPYRFLPPEVVAGTFPGDGRVLWLRGIHRRRTTKADTKTLGGMRVQDTLNPVDDGTYVVSAAKVAYDPGDQNSVVRDQITFSPTRSRISWKRAGNLRVFLLAAAEIFDLLEKAQVGGNAAEPLSPSLAVVETDLSRVRGAYEVSVIDPDVLLGAPDGDEDQVAHAEDLLDVVLEVRPTENSARAVVDVGYEGAKVGSIAVRPVPTRDGFILKVSPTKDITHATDYQQILTDMQASTQLSVYYESGHVYRDGRILRDKVTSVPFRGVEFADFTGFAITSEKPKRNEGQSLHDAIAEPGDDSLFAWVVQRHTDGWLLCDDGAGEVADFLHLDNNGVLNVIHVKAAGNSTEHREIAVTHFEQVVSQAEKSLDYLDNTTLVDHLTTRSRTAAAWHNGDRVPAATVIDQLRARVASDLTYVTIVQPHLYKPAYDAARTAADANTPTTNSRRLARLDNLFHTTRKSIIGRCDDLRIIGST